MGLNTCESSRARDGSSLYRSPARSWLLGAVVLVILLLPATIRAQFFKVYEYGTADAGAVEFSYWTTFIADSNETLNYFGNNVARDGLWAHSVEVEYGLSHKLTVGYYADFLNPEEGDCQYIQSKLLVRYRLFEKYELPVDIALYGEYIIPDRDFADGEKFEFRTIIEKDVGPWRLAFNPILEKTTSGDEVDEGLEFAYAAGIYYENAGDGVWNNDQMHWRPGVEFYGETGELAAAKRSNEQGHYIFPVLDMYYPWYDDWALRWNTGIGFGLGGEADDAVFKSILTLEFLF
jgi:hypothetical protein